jgi:hypothetical protein
MKIKEARLGLGQEYPRIQMTGNHGIFTKRTVRDRSSGDTGGGCRLGHIQQGISIINRLIDERFVLIFMNQ